jgi:hypothetical protein
VVIVPQAAARPGAPSLAAQVDALARNRVAAPEPVTVEAPHRIVNRATPKTLLPAAPRRRIVNSTL